MSKLTSGQDCLGTLKEAGHVYPRNVTAISDILTIKADLGNKMPDKSWMIYMLELFIDSNHRQPSGDRGVPIELDLFCEPGDKVNFIPVFYGNNQGIRSPTGEIMKAFQSVPPEIGHSYLREIVINASERSILYRLRDLNNGKSDSFKLGADNMDGSVDDQVRNQLIKVIKEVKFQPFKHFTGIEWRNNVEYVPHPVRYHAQFSMLRYAESVGSSPESENLGYKPYTYLFQDKDGSGKQYPIAFDNLREMDGSHLL